jgi:hypothetical protein
MKNLVKCSLSAVAADEEPVCKDRRRQFGDTSEGTKLFSLNW